MDKAVAFLCPLHFDGPGFETHHHQNYHAGIVFLLHSVLAGSICDTRAVHLELRLMGGRDRLCVTNAREIVRAVHSQFSHPVRT